MSDRDARTTARGLARYARDYFDAAIAADEVLGERPGYELVAPVPVMFLVAHSIELALKAYLRHQGMSVQETIDLSHDLNRCWRVAVDNGIEDHVTLSNEEANILRVINDLHKSTYLRYIVTGEREFPVFGPLQDLSDKLLDAICPLVGYR